MKHTNYTHSTIALCYLIGNAHDGINDFESRMFNYIIRHEDLSGDECNSLIRKFDEMSYQEILNSAVENLKKCNKKEQLRCLAWMNSLANVDGYLADQEWSIIYNIYKKELNITLDEILAVDLPEIDYTFYLELD